MNEELRVKVRVVQAGLWVIFRPTLELGLGISIMKIGF